MQEILDSFDPRAASEFAMYLAHFQAQKANATLTVKLHFLQGEMSSVAVQERVFRKSPK